MNQHHYGIQELEGGGFSQLSHEHDRVLNYFYLFIRKTEGDFSAAGAAPYKRLDLGLVCSAGDKGPQYLKHHLLHPGCTQEAESGVGAGTWAQAHGCGLWVSQAVPYFTLEFYI